jgi:amino acid adenylation domain-containing protein/FkbM family methyltransferase
MPLEQSSTYRLSLQQKRIWRLQQDGSAYTSACAIQLQGKLDHARLQQALSAFVQRHQIFQIVFRRLSGLKVPCQMLVPNSDFSWQELDLSSLDQAARKRRLHEISGPQACKFNFEAGPLIHCTLATLGPDEHVLVVTVPSLCADSVTLANLASELPELYAGKAIYIPASGEVVQYSEYSEWSQNVFAEPDSRTGKEYWEKQRASSSPEAPLPLEKKPENLPAFHSQQVEVNLPVDAQTGFAEPEFFLGCWQVVLWKLTGQAGVLIGKVFSGRDYEEFEPACGPFAKDLPFISHLRGDLRLNELIKQNQATHETAEEWQTYFSWDANTEPGFFPYAFELEKWAVPQSIDNLEFATLWQYSESDRYKLKLRICQGAANQWRAFLRYDPAFLDAESVTRYGRYLVNIMSAAAGNPARPIADLPLLSEADQQDLRTRFNPEPRPRTITGPTHTIFENIAAEAPARIAVRCGAKQLTYQELSRRSNQLAHYLIKQGVRPEMPVAILAERSPEMMVGLLGIWKAGGAYVPLDPSYPKERLAFVVKDTETKFIINWSRNAGVLPEHNAVTISIDLDWAKIALQPESAPAISLHTGNLAYVIYTSGSTGRPKGTLISHENLVHSTLARQDYYPGTVDSFLLLSSFSFDSSVAGIFWTLCTGGTLCVPEERLEMDVSAIAQTVERFSVSHVLCLPSLYSLLLKQTDTRKLGSLRAVIVAGEASAKDLMAMHHQLLPQTKLYNEYGPTENTVWTTVAELKPEDANTGVPIGRPITNTYAYLLNAQMELIPAGQQGEIYIGGAGLSRGYLRQPSLTAERFVPDPHSSRPGARLYKTGDLAAYRADGQIDFHGRADDQIKLRGYRIELGEIESALRQAPGVKDAVAIVREDEPGDQRLIAYVVPKHPAAAMNGDGSYRLPNGMTIAHLNKNETDYLYQEIFESRGYLKHGIELGENACIVDAGANIGMFTLLASSLCPTAKIFAFEPIPQVFEVLQKNAAACAAACAAEVKVFQCGLAETSRTEDFVYYPLSSMMSSLSSYANREEEIAVVKKFLQNQQALGSSEAGDFLDEANALLAERFKGQVYRCPLRRLSDVIREEKIQQIDLLKIDVQRAELDVLRGIDDADWSKIRQIVIEAHDFIEGREHNRVGSVVKLLGSWGYGVTVEEDEHLKGTDLFNIYAVRNAIPRVGVVQSLQTSGEKTTTVASGVPEPAALRALLRSSLPEYMVPSAIEVLSEFPLLPNGKIDRKALPKPGEKRGRTAAYAPPVSEVETQLASLWSEALRVGQIGIDDNFFDLGGHSFLAIKIHHRLEQLLHREIPLLKLFEFPTVRTLAQFLEQGNASPASETSAEAATDWAVTRRQALQRQRVLVQKIS